jgi:hypothetical protein
MTILGLINPWIDLVNLLPSKPESIEHTRAKIFHNDIANFKQINKNLLTLGRLHVDRDRTLIAIEHGEVKAIRARHIAKLPSGCVTLWGFEFNNICSHPGEQL